MALVWAGDWWNTRAGLGGESAAHVRQLPFGLLPCLGAMGAVLEFEQFGDFIEAEPQTLGRFDESDAVQIAGVVMALYFAWRRLFGSSATCEPGQVCAVPHINRIYKSLFWLVVALVVMALGFPLMAPWFY